jgi:hypothetical protein
MKTLKNSILAGVLVTKFAMKREALAWKHQLSISHLSLILCLPKTQKIMDGGMSPSKT